MEFRAKLTTMLAGDPMRDVGDIVTGDEAKRLVEAGFAVPVRSEGQPSTGLETATVTRKRPKAD